MKSARKFLKIFYSKELLQSGITLLLINPISTGDILLGPEGFLHGKFMFHRIFTLKQRIPSHLSKLM